ncbi:alpha/beta hydrolase [Rhodococcus sp. WMMA185]|uniref:alpha/beta hydrolase n=1 Tax=Rhodococcus sp. WMMA185 TaxID=679318 RepID=UPI000878448F|nr:alpha/beta hydrolase [Rhodococcus sp. WMMA185]AOW92133.1 alpha/beta hydrolase [Rhodococcus sp. WMMA185]
MPNIPVVFIHGLWLHGSSWDPWVELFREKGYEPHNPGWPGDGPTVAETRANPGPIGGCGVEEVTEHFAGVIAELGAVPVVIGHSFGGLVAQKLLGRKLAAAAIAIDPAQMKGVLRLPLPQLLGVLPIVSRISNYRGTHIHTKNSFHSMFGNALPVEESDELYDRYVIPAPGRPLFEAATANFLPNSPTAVDVSADRGPLLIVGGGEDRAVPEASSRSSFRRYRKAPTVNEYKVFDDRGHSLVIDHGWREVADYILSWLAKKNVGAVVE